jgi:hypothetical protein
MLGCRGKRERAWHRSLTALVEGVARAVSETIWAGDLFESRDHAKVLHPRQKRRVGERLVRRDLPSVGCRAGLAEDGRISQLRPQVQRQLVAPRPDIQLAKAIRGRQPRREKCFIRKEETQQGDMRAKGQGRVKNDLGNGECISKRLAQTRLLPIMSVEWVGRVKERQPHTSPLCRGTAS